jgi:hypothetical protein
LIKKKALLYAVGIVLLWRVITSALLCLASVYYPVNPVPADPQQASFYTPLDQGNSFERNFLLPWLRWDTYQYLSIATTGYETEGQTVWPPLFPALIALLAACGLHPILAALLFSTLASVAALYSLYLLVHEEQFCSPRLALFYLLTFPVAFYLLSGYSEALFLALSISCFRQARKGAFLWAAFLAALATLTRQMGLLLAVPLFMEVFRSTGNQDKILSPRRLLPTIGYALLPVLAFVSFRLYVTWGLGYGHLMTGIESHGPRLLVLPGWGIIRTIDAILHQQDMLNPFTAIMDGAFSLLATILCVQGFFRKERLPFSYLVYLLVSLIIITTYVIETKELGSSSRYLLVLFPMYILQAQIWKGKTIRLVWFAFSMLLSIMLLGGFYAGFWIE